MRWALAAPQDMGFAIVAYPLSLIGVAVAAQQRALAGLKQGRIPPADVLPSFQVHFRAMSDDTQPSQL